MASENKFLGTGWTFPPTFNQAVGQAVMVSDTEDVLQSLEILLSTVPGERIMLLDYGTDLYQFVFGELDQNLFSNITRNVKNAISNYEPRITVDNIDVLVDDDDANLLIISVDYTINATNSRDNFVYPFYINEAA